MMCLIINIFSKQCPSGQTGCTTFIHSDIYLNSVSATLFALYDLGTETKKNRGGGKTQSECMEVAAADCVALQCREKGESEEKGNLLER